MLDATTYKAMHSLLAILLYGINVDRQPDFLLLHSQVCKIFTQTQHTDSCIGQITSEVNWQPSPIQPLLTCLGTPPLHSCPQAAILPWSPGKPLWRQQYEQRRQWRSWW